MISEIPSPLRGFRGLLLVRVESNKLFSKKEIEVLDFLTKSLK